MKIKRLIPATVRREIDKQESGEIYLVFLTITSKDFSDEIRVVSDPNDFILDGKKFIGFAFDIKILSDEENAPRATLSVQNIDGKIGKAIRSARDIPRMKIEVIAASEFDLTVSPRTTIGTMERIYRAKYLYLTNVEGSADYVSGDVNSWNYLSESWPGLRTTLARFPGLYWS